MDVSDTERKGLQLPNKMSKCQNAERKSLKERQKASQQGNYRQVSLFNFTQKLTEMLQTADLFLWNFAIDHGKPKMSTWN